MRKFAIGILFFVALLLAAVVGAGADPEVLALNTPTNVTIDEAGETVYFSFIPEKTAYYRYYSTSLDGGDTYGSLYNSNKDEIETNDDGGEGMNFRIVKQLTAGTQYYVGARYLSPERDGTFTVQIEEFEGLINAEAAENGSYYVKSGNTATLQVNTLCVGECELSYRWYVEADNNSYVRVENANSDTLTTGNITSRTQYYCEVNDSFGSSFTIWFNVYVQNHFSATAIGEHNKYVDKNSTTTLTVEVNCDDDEDMSYEWSVGVFDENGSANYEPVLNATTNTITTAKVTEHMVYHCYVSDKYGNSENIYFEIYIDNHFTAERVGDYYTYVDPGKEANLEVSANCSDGNITYKWYKRVYDEYGQSWEAELIEGANGPALKTEKLNQNAVYSCEVNDEYDNFASIDFWIMINNNFWAGSDGSSEIYVVPDSPAVLKIKSRYNDGPLTYVWYRWTEDESGDFDWVIMDGVGTDSCTTDPLSDQASFYCYVSDKYGNHTEIYFYVHIDNKLSVIRNGEANRLVIPNGTVELSVTATRTKGKLTYQWIESYYDEENQTWKETAIQGADTNTYIAGAYAKEYRCVVSDDYGNTETVWFSVNVDNNFKVLTNRENRIFCTQGEDVTLTCAASCADQTLSCRWTLYDPSEGSWNRIEGATTNTYTLKNISANSRLNCFVRDQYGNNSTVYYSVYVSPGMPTLNVGETKSVQMISGKETCSLFSLQPAESGAYRLSNPGIRDDEYLNYIAYLLDADRNVLEELYVGYYDHPSFDLIEDTQYYLAILCESYYSFDHFDIRLVGSNHLVAFTENGRQYYWNDYRMGDSAVLKVYAYCDYGVISYQWYDGDEIIPGATLSTYTVESVEDYMELSCLVSDETGDNIWLGFEVNPMQIDVWTEGSDFFIAEEGETVTLEVKSWTSNESHLYFEWYYDNDGVQEKIEEAETGRYSFRVTAENAGVYWCKVTTDEIGEDSGEIDEFSFTVTLSEAITPTALTLNTEAIATITKAGEYAFFSFTPDSEGTYTLTWHNYRAAGNLCDESWNVIDNIDFYGDDAVPYVHYLEAGKTYYYAMRHGDDSTDPFIVELTKPYSDEEPEGSVKIHVMNTTVGKDEEFALVISSDEDDDSPIAVELWATEGNDTYLAEKWMEGGYSVSTINYISSRPNPTVITYFARAFYYDGHYKESEPVTVMVTDTLQDMGAVSFTTDTENGAIAVTVSCPSYVEAGMVSIWNGSTFYNAPYTVQNPVVVMENIQPGGYSVSVSASATGYHKATVSRRVIAHASTKLILPEETTIIEDEAFFGDAAVEIVLPGQCTTIGDGAFANCSQLRMIYIPDSVVSIDGNAFSGSDHVIFLCQSDNAAADFARDKGIDYIIE